MWLYVIEFIVVFLLVYLYYILILKKKMKKTDNKILPIEINLFVNMINPNMNKITYKKLIGNLAIINALDIAIVVLTTEITDKLILKVVIALSLSILLILGSYKLLGLYYKKKGMIKDV